MSKPPRKNYKTKPEDKVPVLEKCFYALGAVPMGTGMQVVNRMSDVIFNMFLHVSPALVGLAMGIFRMWDAFADPIMGSISDNSRLKWGRRRPYMVLGSILSAITFPFIWTVGRHWSEMVLFSYFLISSLIFYTCYTIYCVPYTSLATEMSPDYHERTRIISLRAFLNKLVGIATGWLLSLVTLKIFKDELQGMHWLSLLVSLIFIVFGILPAIFAKERFFKQASQQNKTKLIESVKITMSSRPFLMVLAMVILMVVASQMVASLGLYLNVYYVCAANKTAAGLILGYSTTAGMIASILSIPVFTTLSRRYGKTVALNINLWLLLIGTLSKWVLVTPDHPYWMILNAILLGPGTTGVWILLPSMQADICDCDELETGRRREGSYSSVFMWINKTGLSVSAMLSGLILVTSGFKVQLGAIQPENTFLWMRIFYCVLPTLAVIGTFLILRKYPLTEERSHEIRAELERRRGTV